MIENNLLKTNFLGSDGFRWWIGQVAPKRFGNYNIEREIMLGVIVSKFV